MTPTVDQQALTRSQAGMRFIAQITLYNGARWERMAAYLRDHYLPEALAEKPADTRLHELQTLYATVGRLHVLQVLATDPHHVVVVVEEEHMPAGTTGASIIDLEVEADYPHRVIAFERAPVAVDWVEDAADAGPPG